MGKAPPGPRRPRPSYPEESDYDYTDSSHFHRWQKPPRRWQPFGFARTVRNALMGGIIVLGLLAGLGALRAGDQFTQTLVDLFNPPPPEPEVDVRSVIVQQLRGASELTTAIFAMEAVVPAKSDRTLGGYVIGTTDLLYVAYGEVRAGVDLNEITVENVQLGESRIRISLPPPRILDAKLDLSRSNVFDYDRGFLGLGPDNAPQLQELAQQEALNKIQAAACQKNILEEANARAELTVQQLLSTAGFTNVEIIPQTVFDTTCAKPPDNDTVNVNPNTLN